MKRLVIYSLLSASLTLFCAFAAHAQATSIDVSVKSTGTSAVVTATCASCYGYPGFISVKNGILPGDGGYLKMKQVVFAQNTPVTFSVSGLSTGVRYTAEANASNDTGASFKGVQYFYPGKPTPSQEQTPPQTSPPQPAQSGTPATQQGSTQDPNFLPSAQVRSVDTAKEGDGTCGDGIDNDLDGRADYEGANGVYEPDPSCYLGKQSTEGAKPNEKSGLISCNNYCTFSDVLKTINNLIVFLITVLFVPIVIIMFMYAGFKYLTAQGDPKKIINLKRLIKNIVVGMLIILSAWLVVKVILTVLVKDTDSALQFLQK